MNVRVIAGRCQGHNNCIRIAPQLFDTDPNGNALVRGDGTVPPHLADKASLAVDNCPESAIELDLDTGRD